MSSQNRCVYGDFICGLDDPFDNGGVSPFLYMFDSTVEIRYFETNDPPALLGNAQVEEMNPLEDWSISGNLLILQLAFKGPLIHYSLDKWNTFYEVSSTSETYHIPFDGQKTLEFYLNSGRKYKLTLSRNKRKQRPTRVSQLSQNMDATENHLSIQSMAPNHPAQTPIPIPLSDIYLDSSRSPFTSDFYSPPGQFSSAKSNQKPMTVPSASFNYLDSSRSPLTSDFYSPPDQFSSAKSNQKPMTVPSASFNYLDSSRSPLTSDFYSPPGQFSKAKQKPMPVPSASLNYLDSSCSPLTSDFYSPPNHSFIY